MYAYRQHSSSVQFHEDPKLGRLVLVSLVLHLVVVLVMGGSLYITPKRSQAPVYYVDLVHKPVLNPQAGRPDPRPQVKAKPAPEKPVAAPPKPKPVEPPKPKPAPAPAKAVEPSKPVVKPVAKPVAKPEPRPAAQTEQNLQNSLEAMRERQNRQAEIDALKQKLAGLQETRTATVPAEVPIGMPTGTGDEIGVSTLAYIEAFIQQNWTLSPYLLDQSRLAGIEARVLLEYSKEGTLTRYRILETSGNSQFDDSIKRAITKSKQLAQTLPRNEELTVVFNLKEMAAHKQ